MAFKIYTKTGDAGETSIFGGRRLPKNHIRLEAYGTVDELNAHIGLIRDSIDLEKVRKILKHIQDRLFTLGSNLANDPEKGLSVPTLDEADVQLLEDSIDEMEEKLIPLQHFILPGGHPLVSYCHVARCVCRRAERNIISLNQVAAVDTILIKYVNRLSDYLFVLARYVTKHLNVEEVKWVGNDK